MPCMSVRPRAYSLLEVIVSLSILAVTILVVIGLFLTMVATSDTDGERMKVSGFLEGYHAELKAKPETDWETQITSGSLIENRVFLGREVRLETTISRLSNNAAQIDYRVYQILTNASWQRPALDGGPGGEEATLELLSCVTPLGRY